MARLSDLTRALAANSSRSETTIGVTARAIREAGLITTGPRGLNAPHMSAVDAANLLIGLACPGDHTKAGKSVLQAGALKLEAMGMDDRGDLVGLQRFENHLGCYFGQPLRDGLAALLERYPLEGRCPPAGIPTPASEEVGRLGEKRRAPLFSPRPKADPALCAVSITVTTDGVDWDADLVVDLGGAGRVRLHFSRYGDVWPPEGPSSEKPEYLEVFATTLQPHMFHAVVCCIRNEDPSRYPFRKTAQ